MLLLAGCLCAGCATPRKGESGGFMQRYAGSKKLAQAVEMLTAGDSPGAAKVLDAICTDTPVAGVTDEALFRLALLSLKPSAEKPASAQAHRLLKRLKKEYPASPWTAQAAPLIELINVSDDLSRQNKSTKAANHALTREVNELNKHIKQLKRLDQELEKSTR